MVTFEQVPIDQVQSFWDRRPCNVRHSLLPLGTKEYFDQVEARKYLVEPHIPRFAEFPRWQGKRVLEIGCGIGTDTVNFARNGAQVTAVELSPASLAIARDRIRVFGLEDRVRLFEGNVEELTSWLPVEPFDLIYSFGVIHHTPHPERALAAMRRYAKAGTVVKVMVYNRHSWKVLWIVLTAGAGAFWRAKELVARNSEAQTGCPVTYTYTRAEARQLFARADLRVTDVAVEHIFPYRVSDYIQHRLVKVWYFRYMPPALFRFLERRFGWHLCVTAEAA